MWQPLIFPLVISKMNQSPPSVLHTEQLHLYNSFCWHKSSAIIWWYLWASKICCIVCCGPGCFRGIGTFNWVSVICQILSVDTVHFSPWSWSTMTHAPELWHIFSPRSQTNVKAMSNHITQNLGPLLIMSDTLLTHIQHAFAWMISAKWLNCGLGKEQSHVILRMLFQDSQKTSVYYLHYSSLQVTSKQTICNPEFFPHCKDLMQ